MKRYCPTLDLKNDPKLIAEYDHHHKQFGLRSWTALNNLVFYQWRYIVYKPGFL